MLRKSALFTALIALPFMGLAACGDATGPDGSGVLTVQLTDEPSASVDKAWVDVEQITLQGDDGSVPLLEQRTGLIELTQLADSTMTLVENDTVPQGTYGQLRFEIAASALRTEDGQVYSSNGAASALDLAADGELQCPSCPQTGIKVNMPDGGLTLESEAEILMLDFVVSESYGQQAGMSGMWVMHPVIRSSTVEASGSIAGTVTAADTVSFPTCAGSTSRRSVQDFVPKVLENGTENVVGTDSDVESDGSYEILFLSPADYDMSYADTVVLDSDSLFFTASPSDTDVTVGSGAQTTVNFTIEGVTCSGS